MLMTNDSQPPGFDVSSYTIEEINRITSEYTLKNTVSTSDLHLTEREEHRVLCSKYKVEMSWFDR